MSKKKFIIFKLGDEKFGVDIQKVLTIEKMMDITRVPKSPDYVNGIINLRGNVIPVMSLRKRFGVGEDKINDLSRIIITTLKDGPMGIIVDEVKRVKDVMESQIDNTKEIESTKVDEEFISGIAKIDGGIITLLDFKKLIAASFKVKKIK